MDKINFIIPNKDSLKIYKNLNKNKYLKLDTNVYKFINNSSDELYNLINILYNEALFFRYNNINKSINLFKECEKLIQNTSNKNLLELYYEIYVNLALLTEQTSYNYNIINNYYTLAINICPDKAEPYYYFSLYCAKIQKYENSYELLHKALNCSYDVIKNKYTNIDIKCYGKYLYFELSEVCYLLKKNEEGIKYLNKIKNDNELIYLQELINSKLDMYNRYV